LIFHSVNKTRADGDRAPILTAAAQAQPSEMAEMAASCRQKSLQPPGKFQ
jgi:hypothetical protein